MVSSRSLLLLVVVIPLWYAHRTATDERFKHIDWRLFSRRTERQSLTKHASCVSEVAAAEKSYQELIREQSAYGRFIEKLLSEPVPQSSRLPKEVFVSAVRVLRAELLSDEELRAHHQSVVDTGRRCESFSRLPWADSETDAAVLDLRQRRWDWNRTLRVVKSSREDIELLIRYREQGFQNTLDGELSDERVRDLVYRSTGKLLQR